MRPRIVAIGGSAGAIEVLCTILPGLPVELPASVLVAIHLPEDAPSALAQVLARRSRLPVVPATDGLVLESGRIYVAPPGAHCVVWDGQTKLVGGPRENGHRPAIDKLFRSVARHHGPNAIGVLLSGMLDDGADGLAEIKARGGVAIVQSPADATWPGMPESALAVTDVDDVVPADAIAGSIVRYCEVEAASAPPEDETRPDEEQREAGAFASIDTSAFACPECGGVLKEVDPSRDRFACRTGHAFSMKSLQSAHSARLEGALWAAINALEERRDMTLRLERKSEAKGLRVAARRYQAASEEAQKHATALRSLVAALQAAATVGDDDDGHEN